MIPAMVLAALLLARSQPAQAQPVQPPRPPQDWSTLPQLRYLEPPRPDARLSLYVRGEVAAGRCAAAVQGTDGWTLRVEFAVLVAPEGQAHGVVPRAIGCSTVEQFAAGALSRIVRDNLYPTGAAEDAWRRTALVFAWTG